MPHTLQKQELILAAIKTRIQKTTHKYGIESATSVEHTYKIDKINGNTMWRDALHIEMYNVGVVFEVLDEGQKAPDRWHHVTGQCENGLHEKTWTLDSHKTLDPVVSNFAGVVSWESVRIAFTYAALNDLDTFAVDIHSAYLQAPSSWQAEHPVWQTLMYG